MTRGLLLATALAGGLGGCSGGGEGNGDGGLVHGCSSLEEPLASPGDAIEGDDWGTFASPFFQAYCTRCHDSALPEGEARGHSPVGIDLDRPESVREHAAAIRRAVGVLNYMPPSAPTPACDERRRVVRWIDAALPGT